MEENNNLLDDKEMKEKEPKKIEVVSGSGDLNISPVYEHLEVEKPKPKENREIVIPEVKETISKEQETNPDEKNISSDETNSEKK